jgi:hypothetical protein
MLLGAGYLRPERAPPRVCHFRFAEPLRQTVLEKFTTPLAVGRGAPGRHRDTEREVIRGVRHRLWGRRAELGTGGCASEYCGSVKPGIAGKSI